MAMIPVEEHGATGDGTTNDTAALQRAHTACKPGDTVLYEPGVTYRRGRQRRSQRQQRAPQLN